MNKTCLAPKWGKILQHNICVVQMQRSLFSCVTKANLDSDSALQPSTLNLNTNSLSHAGPEHMWEASYRLSILSSSLVGERPWGQVPEQPLSSLSLRSTKMSFSRTFYFSQSWNHSVSGWSFPGLPPPLTLWQILNFLMIWLKNLKFPCRKTNNSNPKTIQSIIIQPFQCLQDLTPGIRSQAKKAGKIILESSSTSERMLVGDVMVQKHPAGFVPILKLHIPWAPSGIFEEHRVKDSGWSRGMMCMRSFWIHGIWSFGVYSQPLKKGHELCLPQPPSLGTTCHQETKQK